MHLGRVGLVFESPGSDFCRSKPILASAEPPASVMLHSATVQVSSIRAAKQPERRLGRSGRISSKLKPSAGMLGGVSPERWDPVLCVRV